MKITNKLGLPEPFVQMADSDYRHTDGRYSVTSMLKGVREIMLERRHADEIEQDVGDMIWLLFGKAVHSILENSEELEHQFKEVKLAEQINQRIVSGQFDLYDAKELCIDDYKTCSVWKVIFGDVSDWEKQLLMYAVLLECAGFPVKRGRIIAVMKDHSKGDAKRKPDYPQHPVQVFEFSFPKWKKDEMLLWLENKIDLLKQNEDVPDDALPLCAEDERWTKPTTYAVKKKGVQKAVRVLASRAEAEEYMTATGKGDFIEERAGVDAKCVDYCSACQFCSYWQAKYAEGVGENDSTFEG